MNSFRKSFSWVFGLSFFVIELINSGPSEYRFEPVDRKRSRTLSEHSGDSSSKKKRIQEDLNSQACSLRSNNYQPSEASGFCAYKESMSLEAAEGVFYRNAFEEMKKDMHQQGLLVPYAPLMALLSGAIQQKFPENRWSNFLKHEQNSEKISQFATPTKLNFVDIPSQSMNEYSKKFNSNFEYREGYRSELAGKREISKKTPSPSSTVSSQRVHYDHGENPFVVVGQQEVVGLDQCLPLPKSTVEQSNLKVQNVSCSVDSVFIATATPSKNRQNIPLTPLNRSREISFSFYQNDDEDKQERKFSGRRPDCFELFSPTAPNP